MPETEDPGQAFAALMSKAAQSAAPAVDPEAPFGYTTDPATGERRPKKTAGRPRKSPSVDDLKAAQAEADADPATGAAPGEDVAPVAGKRKRRGVYTPPAGKDSPGTPQHRPGVITKGVNRLYRRAGKIVKAMDRDIGIAIIESTKNTAEDGEPDDSVGAAWDELARTNPRIRRFLLRVIAGGAWGQLLMAHAPIFLAIVMKDGIRKHIPFMKLIEAMAEQDDDSPEGGGGLGGLLAGMKPEDMEQMMGLAQKVMGQQAARAA